MNFGKKCKTGLNSKRTQEQLKRAGLEHGCWDSQSVLRGKIHSNLHSNQSQCYAFYSLIRYNQLHRNMSKYGHHLILSTQSHSWIQMGPGKATQTVAKGILLARRNSRGTSKCDIVTHFIFTLQQCRKPSQILK